MQTFEPSAFTGLVASSTLLANLHYESFKHQLEMKSLKFWLLLGVLMVLPFLITLLTLTVLFK